MSSANEFHLQNLNNLYESLLTSDVDWNAVEGKARSAATRGGVLASDSIFGNKKHMGFILMTSQKLRTLCEYSRSFWSLQFSRMENNDFNGYIFIKQSSKRHDTSSSCYWFSFSPVTTLTTNHVLESIATRMQNRNIIQITKTATPMPPETLIQVVFFLVLVSAGNPGGGGGGAEGPLVPV